MKSKFKFFYVFIFFVGLSCNEFSTLKQADNLSMMDSRKNSSLDPIENNPLIKALEDLHKKAQETFPSKMLT